MLGRRNVFRRDEVVRQVVSGLRVLATVINPSGEDAQEVELLQTAPGHYEAEADLGEEPVNRRSLLTHSLIPTC